MGWNLQRQKEREISASLQRANHTTWTHIQFNTKEPSLAKVRNTIRAAWASTALGLSGVPYKVYKHCPRLLERLCKLLRIVAKRWWHAEGVWITKEENANYITQFCSISLLRVEGEVFFKTLANQLMEKPPKEFLFWHHGAEWRSSRDARLCRTHRNRHPVDPWGKGKPRRSVSHLTWPG